MTAVAWPSEAPAAREVYCTTGAIVMAARRDDDGSWSAGYMGDGGVDALVDPDTTWGDVTAWPDFHVGLVDLREFASISPHPSVLEVILFSIAREDTEKADPRRVYFIQAGDSGPIKIGVARDVSSRLAALQTANAEPLRVLADVEGGYAAELNLHTRFAADRIRGEWFKPSPDLLNHIRSAA